MFVSNERTSMGGGLVFCLGDDRGDDLQIVIFNRSLKDSWTLRGEFSRTGQPPLGVAKFFLARPVTVTCVVRSIRPIPGAPESGPSSR